MRTYQQRTSGQQPQGLAGIRAAVQHSPLQRAIDTGARMQAQQQRVGALRQQAVLQAKPKWLGKLLGSKKTYIDTVTAHSPGIYTGPVNALSPISQTLNAADKYKGLADAGKLANTTMGYATASASAIGDAVGAFYSIKTLKENGPLGKTDWKSADYAKKAEARAAFKSAATDLSGQAVDTGAQISSIIGSTSTTATYATQALQVAPFGGALVNAGVGIRATVSAWRAGKYYKQLNAISDRNHLNHDDANPKALDAQVTFAKNQMAKRRKRQAFGAAGAFLGTGGAIALGVAGVALGVAAMATPVGWALAGAGAAVALGIGIYKAGKYIKKRRDGKLGTERTAHATEIMKALQGGPSERAEAEALLQARGVKDVDGLRTSNQTDGIKYIERKLKSW